MLKDSVLRSSACIACIALGVLVLLLELTGVSQEDNSSFVAGSAFVFVGLFMLFGFMPKVKYGKGGAAVEFEPMNPEPVKLERKVLDEETERENEAFAESKILPNDDAPKFTPFDPHVAKALKINPSGFARVPMYLLDSSFRILDWNEAFSLAFDRTMEGRVGSSVLKWTMHLKNFREVTEEGIRAFGDPENIPTFHKEEIEYESLRYGLIKGTKRAYAIPDDDGQTIAWLVSVEPRFLSFNEHHQYELDVVRLLENDLMWSEYALLYDTILCKTRIYQDLIMKMVGERGELDEPAPGAQILDLGAGTGNLAAHLMEMSPDYRIVALEKNLTMRDMLFDKCERYRATAPNGAGVTIFKQDVTSLNGFDDDSFDYAFMNNVLYAVEDYRGCLEEALRVLRPGGEIRISGPHPTSDAGELFTHLRRDLEHGGHMDRLEKQYSRVKWINKFQLLPKAHKFSTEQLSEILIDVGFSEVIDANYDVYKGQSFMVAARK